MAYYYFVNVALNEDTTRSYSHFMNYYILSSLRHIISQTPLITALFYVIQYAEHST